jgi:hypothetical protein
MSNMENTKMKQRSLFFPLALIAAGSIWILIGMGRIPSENLWALARFWPFLLIAAGIGLILRSYWAPAQIVMDVLVVGGAVLAILYAPQLGWTSPQWGWGMGVGSMYEGGAPGSGKIVSQMREVSGFQAISLEYPADVTIQQGASESVKLEGDDNLLPQLSTQVAAGTLTIRNSEPSWNRRVNPKKSVRITITVKDLHEIDFSSAGDMRVTNLETDALNISLSGAGHLTIDKLSTRRLECNLSGAGSFNANGVADKLSLNISGVGSFDGAALTGSSADVHLSGVGSATVHPKDALSAEVSGVGSVRYYGNPRVNKQVSGLGTVSQIGQ